jgi:hypothetical protein
MTSKVPPQKPKYTKVPSQQLPIGGCHMIEQMPIGSATSAEALLAVRRKCSCDTYNCKRPVRAFLAALCPCDNYNHNYAALFQVQLQLQSQLHSSLSTTTTVTVTQLSFNCNCNYNYCDNYACMGANRARTPPGGLIPCNSYTCKSPTWVSHPL